MAADAAIQLRHPTTIGKPMRIIVSSFDARDACAHVERLGFVNVQSFGIRNYGIAASRKLSTVWLIAGNGYTAFSSRQDVHYVTKKSTSLPSSPPRSRRARDPEASRRALLDAATQHFSARGLKGARIDAIARAAGVNKQLVYHYFGSKEALYLQVLESAYEAFREGDHALRLPTMDPVAAVRTLVASTVRKIHEQRQFPTLVIDENFHEARHIRRSANIRRLHEEMLATIGDVLERGHRQAGFRGGVDALQLYTTIASLASFYVTNGRTMEAIFSDRFRALAVPAVITAHIEALVLGFLVPQSEARIDPVAPLRRDAAAPPVRAASPATGRRRSSGAATSAQARGTREQ